MKRDKQKIVMSTAYSYIQAKHCDDAEIDSILVGDSLGMTELVYLNIL